MKFLIFVIGLVLTTNGIAKVNSLPAAAAEYNYNDYENNMDLRQGDEGEEIPWYWMTKRDEALSMTTRALEFTEDGFLLPKIIPILDNNIKEDFNRIITNLKKNNRDLVAINLSGLAWNKTKGCARLSESMETSRRIALQILYVLSKLLYDDEVLKPLSKNDQQILKTAEQNVANKAQLLCK